MDFKESITIPGTGKGKVVIYANVDEMMICEFCEERVHSRQMWEHACHVESKE